MKIINFINTLSAAQHKELTRWAQTTAILSLAIITIIIVITSQKLITLNALKKKQSSTSQTFDAYTHMASKNESLKKQELTLKEKLTLISSWSEATQKSAQLLQAIQKNISDFGIIESMTLNDKKITLMALSNQTHDAMMVMKSLKKIPELSNLNLISLQPTKKAQQSSMRLNMHASWK